MNFQQRLHDIKDLIVEHNWLSVTILLYDCMCIDRLFHTICP